MALSLKDFTKYKNIVIQCHDNPDADALASGFAVKWYLAENGITAPFIYSGRNAVQKSNLVIMMDELKIDAKYVTELEKPELLIMVDCQYGESNVTRFEAETIATIDHHQLSGNIPELSDIRSNYGSCSTILFELLRNEGIDINDNPNLATALYYGLMTDTGGFAEISHPADKDLRDYAKYSASDITLFRNSNFSREELHIAADALKKASYNDEYRFGTIASKPCDPNILGLIGDMFLEVDSIDTCLIYCMLPFGAKFSVRSCVKEVKANELAAFLAEGMGGGGGHLVKAGGLLKRELLENAGIPFEDESIRNYLYRMMEKYFKESHIIVAGQHSEDLSKLSFYRKKSVIVGYVKASDLAPVGTVILIRTLEGDVEVPVDSDIYIIIGVDGEIYPCREAKFKNNYDFLDEPYVYPAEYEPSVINVVTNDRLALLPYAKSCLARGGSGIYARELTERVKVFTAWDPGKYYLGKQGDYLAVRVDDLSDIYVIERSIFEKTYQKEEMPEGQLS